MGNPQKAYAKMMKRHNASMKRLDKTLKREAKAKAQGKPLPPRKLPNAWGEDY